MTGDLRERIRRAAVELEDPGLPPPAPRPVYTDPLTRLGERLVTNGGEWHRPPDQAAARAWLDEFAAGFASMTVSKNVPASLRPALATAPPEQAELGIGLARLAVAESGTLILDSREGRKSQLLPPTHLIWIEAANIVADLPAALERLAPDLPAALGFHSGPSRSADLGGITVLGVHGPGRVIVVLIAPLEPL